MYQNYIFDLYGTLVDIRTNENSPYLWRKMSEFYAALGAVYTARELKLEYGRLVGLKVREAAERLMQSEGWQRAQNEQPKAGWQGKQQSMEGEPSQQQAMRTESEPSKPQVQKEEGEPSESQAQKAQSQLEAAEKVAEPDLTEVFAELYHQKGAACDRAQARLTAVMFRTISRSKLCLYDGVTDFLTKLREKGKGVYLLSNAQSDFTRPELDKLGLIPYFDGVFISSEEGVKKPSPQFFCRLLEKYGLDPATCVMVGNDETSDIAGAKAAGMDCLYIHTEISPAVNGEVNADYLVMDGDFHKVEGLILRAISPVT